PIVAGIIARLMSENASLVSRDAGAVQRIYDLLTSSATRITLGNADFEANFGAKSPRLIAYIGGLHITRQPESFRFGPLNHAASVTVVRTGPAGRVYSYKW